MAASNKNNLRSRISGIKGARSTRHEIMQEAEQKILKQTPAEIETIKVDKIKNLMKINRLSARKKSWSSDLGKKYADAAYILTLYKDYKYRNQEDLVSGIFKSHINNLYSALQNKSIDDKQIEGLLNNINECLRGEIKKTMLQEDIEIKLGIYKKIDPDYYRIARLDFDCKIYPVPEEKLTPEYTKALKSPQSSGNFSEEEYRKVLGAETTWGRCSEFPNFANLEDKVLNALNKYHISPQIAAQMKIADFEDLLYKNSGRNADKMEYVDLFGRDNARTQFVKFLAGTPERKEEFARIMVAKGASKEYAKALIEVMSRSGNLNPGPIEVDGVKISPPNFTLSVHHKHAIQDMGSLDKKSSINDFENFMVAVDKPYHQPICHGLDLPDYREDKTTGEFFTERLEFPKGTVMLGGFDKSQRMVYNFEKDKLSRRLYSWLGKRKGRLEQKFQRRVEKYFGDPK